MTNTLSRIVDRTLSRQIKSFRKRLSAIFSTQQTQRDSSPDAPLNPDQNVNEIAPSDSGGEDLNQTISNNGVQAIPASFSELQCQQLSTSPVFISQVDPVDEHASSQFSDVSDDFYFDRFWQLRHCSHNRLPEVTISATIETGQPESSIKVPKQRKYTGRKPAIPSSLADMPCAALGVQGVLDRLNATLGTSHTLDTPSVLFVLEDCIAKNYDFGKAYGHLRGIWDRSNESTINDELHIHEEKDKQWRQQVLVEALMEQPPPPRRVWDLCSNRIVPWWIAGVWPKPISHAWVDVKERMDVWTTINGKEWPVPIPKDAHLDLIRIEMLNLGVEYTWLDVLCLRQTGSPREDLRVDEWKLDVPTIGHVYKEERVVIYLSGLGLPLSLKDGDLESDRCWFRRARTLQEVGKDRIIAGDTPDGPMHAEPDNNGNYETEILTRFRRKLKHMRETTSEYHLFSTLADMRTRVSTNPVDRVAGLSFCLQANRVYHQSETEEDAWTALVNAMGSHMRGCILFLYPAAGLGGMKWRLTWEQVMSGPLPVDDLGCFGVVQHDDEADKDCDQGTRIEEAIVQGLNAGSAEGINRWGELVVKDTAGMQHTFEICATHQFPIPQCAYTLLGDVQYSGGSVFWVVGQSLPDQHFEKLSVITMPHWEERARLAQCGVVKSRCKTYLI